MRVAQWRPLRAGNCDDLIARLRTLEKSQPPLRLETHTVTADLLHTRSPENDAEYKHREDLIDAALAAWTALLWHSHGHNRCQVLGPPASQGREPTIIAPTVGLQRPEPTPPAQRA